MAAGRSRLMTVLIALALFVAGGITGAGLLVGVVRHRLVEIRDDPAAAIERVEATIARRHGLDDAQRAVVGAALRKRLAAVAAARRRMVDESVRPELEALTGEIEDVLAPEQRGPFRERWKTVRERWLQR